MTEDMLSSVSSDGLVVAEAELSGDDPTKLIAEARDRGANLLWVHANADLRSFGFSPADGYVRLRAQSTPAGTTLPQVPEREYARLLDGAYRGLWGHKQVAADAKPSGDAIVVGLYESDEWIGLCTVLPAERLIDGPGIVSGYRAAPRYASLLLGACAYLAPGPADVDSWGDAPEVLRAYTELGFTAVEQVDGWELRLL